MKFYSTCICLALVACAGPSTFSPAANGQPGTTGAPAPINIAEFSNSGSITNPYLPMIPGSTYVYDGSKGSKSEHDTIYTEHRLKKIIGIPCTIQLDSGYLNGKLVEKTRDYFAQDSYGNVWYFGENATQYRNGKVNGHRGSWMAGVNGAKPGIVMEANPRVGDKYNQENAPGIAEDKARVLSLTASVHTPYGNFIGNALKTLEWSPLDPPGSQEHKWYAAGVGFLKSKDVHGTEVLSLTSIKGG